MSDYLLTFRNGRQEMLNGVSFLTKLQALSSQTQKAGLRSYSNISKTTFNVCLHLKGNQTNHLN